MKQEEKQRKFHEALLQMLYPPPSSHPHQEEHGEEHLKILINPRYHLPGELEDEKRNSSSSSDDNGDENCVLEKLTRAQRKRLRKKKLKAAPSQRRKIIGPLLPDREDDGNDVNVDVVENTLEGVRQNVTSENNTVTGSSGEPASCSKPNKIKQRRKSKKMSGINLPSSKH